jgi:glycosyltransferase involved in cell wall biosynthesis
MSPVLQLVVPCYNEADRLDPEPFLQAVRTEGGLDILFVDDGSTDATAAVLADIAAKAGGRISVLQLEQNAGKAAAVRLGVLKALNRGAEFVGFWDADLSTPLSALPEFMDVFVEYPDVEIVIGARVKLLGREIRRNLIRHYSGRLFATAASFALGIGVYDTQCGAKVFRATARVRSAFDRPFQSRWIFDVEILARYVAACGVAEVESHVYELPLRRWRDVPGSKLRVRHAVRAAWDLMRISRY